jgi:hypothetical protein
LKKPTISGDEQYSDEMTKQSCPFIKIFMLQHLLIQSKYVLNIVFSFQEELVCGGCSDVSRAQMCPKHGTDYLVTI